MANDERLALLGGGPAITLDQEEASRWPVPERDEIEAVSELVRGGTWSQLARHGEADQLEREFADYIGVRHALAHNNGTSALHACAFALGLGPGDEVIVPSATYWATVMPMLTTGAIPVFADVDPVFLNLDPNDVEGKITPRTKAVVVCHQGGMPCDMDAFTELARRRGIALVEDASHAHRRDLQGPKDRVIRRRCRLLHAGLQAHAVWRGGHLRLGLQRVHGQATLLGHYERVGELEDPEQSRFKSTGLGYKYRISPLHAALGRVSLSKLDQRNSARNGGIEYLYEQLAEIPGVTPAPVPDHVDRVYFLPGFVLYEPAELGGLPVDRFVEALYAEGAKVTGGTHLRHTGGLHTQPLFAERRHWAFEHPANRESLSSVTYGDGTLPVTEDLPVNRISFPNLPRPSRELLDQYVEAFRKVAVHASDLM